MDRKTLDEKIEKRVNEQVQQDINDCRLSIAKAIQKLCCMFSMDRELCEGSELRKDSIARTVLEQLLSDNPCKGWHERLSLWDDRREQLTKDILEKMDVVQRMLVAKGGPAENTPAVPDGTMVPIEL